jgi:trehalose 6-phosphate phosphatase
VTVRALPEPLLPVRDAVAERLAGTPLVVMLDVDGTLAPIAPRPEAAEVPTETRRVVAALAARPGVHVALVSGRAAADARRMVGASNAWVIGNHGYEVVGPDGETEIDPRVAAFRPVIGQAARRLAPRLAPVPGVLLENKGWTLSIHYRLADPGVLTKVRGAVEDAALALGLRVTEGKKILEVRPPLRVDKGTAVVTLGRKLGGLSGDGSLAFIGDDRTDEDAFQALRHGRAPAGSGRAPVTVHVAHEEARAEPGPEQSPGHGIPAESARVPAAGHGPAPGGYPPTEGGWTVRLSGSAAATGAWTTAAEFAVRNPAEVRTFLEWLLAARR